MVYSLVFDYFSHLETFEDWEVSLFSNCYLIFHSVLSVFTSCLVKLRINIRVYSSTSTLDTRTHCNELNKRSCMMGDYHVRFSRMRRDKLLEAWAEIPLAYSTLKVGSQFEKPKSKKITRTETLVILFD